MAAQKIRKDQRKESSTAKPSKPAPKSADSSKRAGKAKTAPKPAKLEKAKPEKAKPVKALPEKALPEKAKPVKALPPKAKPEKLKSEKAKLEKAKPEKAKPEKPKLDKERALKAEKGAKQAAKQKDAGIKPKPVSAPAEKGKGKKGEAAPKPSLPLKKAAPEKAKSEKPAAPPPRPIAAPKRSSETARKEPAKSEAPKKLEAPIEKTLKRVDKAKEPPPKRAPEKAAAIPPKPSDKGLQKAAPKREEAPVRKAPPAEREKLQKPALGRERPLPPREEVSASKGLKHDQTPKLKPFVPSPPPPPAQPKAAEKSKPVAEPKAKGKGETLPEKKPVAKAPEAAAKAMAKGVPSKGPGEESKPRKAAPEGAPAKGKREPSGEARTTAATTREITPRLAPIAQQPSQAIKRLSTEERAADVEKRVEAQSDEFRKRYFDSFDMSWIYHDSALEGVVYTFEELRAALFPQPGGEANPLPSVDDIRRHKEAILFVRDFATKKRLPITVDLIKKIYLILHPEEGDVKTVKYRKDIPQHRLYFHEYAPPDKIAYKVRQVIDWLNDPETRKTRNGIRIAARAHFDLLRVYPFPTDSGKVARLFMNLLLMRSGLPPSIIHSTERQRYYEGLKSSASTVLQMVQEAVENALASVEKLLNEHETGKRAFIS